MDGGVRVCPGRRSQAGAFKGSLELTVGELLYHSLEFRFYSREIEKHREL